MDWDDSGSAECLYGREAKGKTYAGGLRGRIKPPSTFGTFRVKSTLFFSQKGWMCRGLGPPWYFSCEKRRMCFDKKVLILS